MATSPGLLLTPRQTCPPQLRGFTIRGTDQTTRHPGGVVLSWYAVLCPLCCPYALQRTVG